MVVPTADVPPITTRPNLIERHSSALMLGVFVVVVDDKLGHVTSHWQNYGMFHLIGKVCILEVTTKVQNTVFVNEGV